MEQPKWMWIASSDDGCYQKTSKGFATKKECYDDMRNAALEKVKWNTNYDEDFEPDVPDDEQSIGYQISFQRNEIQHSSYSGLYTYKIVPYTKTSYPRFLIGGEIKGRDEKEIETIEKSIKNIINNALKTINAAYRTNLSIESTEHIILD